MIITERHSRFFKLKNELMLTRHSTINIRLRVMLFLIGALLAFVLCFLVFGDKLGIGIIQKFSRPIVDDESLPEQFIVLSPSVFAPLTGRIGTIPTDDVWQMYRRQSPTADDQALLDQFYVQPRSDEHWLPVRNGTVPTDAVWQEVGSTKYKFFVYSAYLDTRIESVGPLVRIIGAAHTKDPDQVFCRLWYSGSSRTVTAYVHVILENKGYKYSAVYVLCKLPSDIEKYPLSVSVVSHVGDGISNEILIRIPNETAGFKTDLAICIKPLEHHYNYETRLVEFVELNYLLGARHFTFNRGSVGPNVQRVLDRYKKDDLISVLPWYRQELFSENEIRFQGQLASINDCLYRNMYTSKFVAFLDVDEMIVPTHNDTLIQLIDTFESQLDETPAAYSFANAFFYTEWPDEVLSPPNNHNQIESNISVLHKTRRSTLINPHRVRSKYVCDPRRVLEAGINFVWEYLNGDKMLNVRPEDAKLHHYRSCKCNVNETNFVIDRTVHKYRDELVDRITNTLP